MIYVGIDTGVNTGFAVWDSKQRSLLQVCSLPIHKAMERVRSLYDEYKAGIGDKVIVRVEDPRQRTWFGTERMSREMERKKLQGVVLDPKRKYPFRAVIKVVRYGTMYGFKFFPPNTPITQEDRDNFE